MPQFGKKRSKKKKSRNNIDTSKLKKKPLHPDSPEYLNKLEEERKIQEKMLAENQIKREAEKMQNTNTQNGNIEANKKYD